MPRNINEVMRGCEIISHSSYYSSPQLRKHEFQYK